MIPFQHPFTGICCGPTGCGKTELMKNIILNSDVLINPKPDKIIWFYSQYQPQLEKQLEGLVEFRECLPEMKDFDDNENKLIIIDDYMAECNSSISDLFTKGSHHKNLSIWFLMQNFFHSNKNIRTITRNAQYLIMFKNPRDIMQIKFLSNQMYGKSNLVLEEAYKDATQKPFGYLLIDLKQQTADHLRLRTNILPNEMLTLYACKKSYKLNYVAI